MIEVATSLLRMIRKGSNLSPLSLELRLVIIGWYYICKDWLGCICDIAPLAEAKEDKCR